MREIVIGLAIIFLIVFIVAAAHYPYSPEAPKELQVKEIPEWAKPPFRMLGLPESWLWFPAIIYLFFVPFLGICAILIGFLSAIGFFGDRVNFVIALVIALSLIPFGLFTRIAAAMFATLGMYSVFAFGFLFFFGILYVILNRLHRWGFLPASKYKDIVVDANYHSLRRWYIDIYTDYSGVPQVANILQNMWRDLRRAHGMWNRGEKRNAVDFLHRKALRYYRDLTQAMPQAIIKRPPRI